MTTATYLVGDVFERMAEIPDGSVDLVITSPPFYRLRSYLPDDHPDKPKEIGSEATPADYLDTMLALTAEWGRVLAPHGSICVELGDTYCGSGGAGGDYDDGGLRDGQQRFNGSARAHADDLPPDKSLLFIPSLYAGGLAYGRNLLTGAESPAGRWRVRNLVAWVRPNPPVGALGDKYRPATSYLTIACRARDRYFDLDAVRTPIQHPNATHTLGSVAPTRGDARDDASKPLLNNPAGAPPLDWWNHVDLLIDDEIAQRAGKADGAVKPTQPQWKNARTRQGGPMGPVEATVRGAQGSHIRRRLEQAGYLGGPTDDVWDIAPSGYPGAHYAVYPEALCVRPILTMTPQRVCTTCGKPSRRIVGDTTYERTDTDRVPARLAMTDGQRVAEGVNQHHQPNGANTSVTAHRDTLGWSDCGHNTWRPGHVLDPFGGTGTTGAVATGHGRACTLIDLDDRNAELARQRIGMFLEVIPRGVPLSPTEPASPQTQGGAQLNA